MSVKGDSNRERQVLKGAASSREERVLTATSLRIRDC